jgi:hypothetical protein
MATTYGVLVKAVEEQASTVDDGFYSSSSVLLWSRLGLL